MAWNRRIEGSKYVFLNLRPLPHLPNSEKSLDYLRRLADDPGIKAVMKRYRWTVGTLQEMEPIGNTTMDSKTLGRNWNKGEAIEIRLRTDAYDGWRDYKTVRKTMCHELAHMVHGDHDRAFWDLTNKLEREVDAADWRLGGRPLTDQVFYNPPEAEVPKELWQGGSFRLGGSESGQVRTASSTTSGGMSMRERMAKAAEERMKMAYQ